MILLFKKFIISIILIILIIFISRLLVLCIKNEDYVTYNNIHNIRNTNLPSHNNVLLLTTYNTKENQNIYVNNIKWWLENSLFDIYVVNSSGKDFNEHLNSNRLKIFTYDQYNYAPKGKSTTYYELLSIKKIIEHFPSIVNDYTMIIKLTGKYKLPSLENEVKKIPQYIDIIFQNNRCHLNQNTELIGFKSEKILDIIKYTQECGNIFERCMSKIKSKSYITLRLGSINIPKEYRVRRSDNLILKYL